MKKNVYSLYACLFVLLTSPAIQAENQVAHFCSTCVDESSARHKALMFAPPPVCDYGNPPTFPPASCEPQTRRVILGNHLTRQKFAFIVETFDSVNKGAFRDSLSATEQEVIDTIFDLRRDWESIDFEWTVDGGSVAGGTAGKIPLSSQTTGDGNCPSNTALDHVLNPEFRQPLEDAIILRTMNHLDDYAGMNPRVRRLTGVGVTIAGQGFSLQWENPDQNHFIASFGFNNSEVDSPIRDVLVFRVELVSMNMGTPVLDIDFAPEASRAAGINVENLMKGEVAVNNQCVLDKLAQLQNDNPDIEFRLGGPGGALFDFSDAAGSTNDGEVCSRRVCATVTIDGVSTCQFIVRIVATICD